MKKILSIAFLTLFSSLFAGSMMIFAATGDCGELSDLDSASVKTLLSNCKPNNVIVSKDGDYTVKGGARDKVIAIANQLILAGSVLAVGAIVYAAILYIIAAGDDEKIKKAKSSLKFGIIGFIMMLLSFPLVNAIIKLFYSTSS